MVRLMLDGLRSGKYGDFEIRHIDARFSDTIGEIGGRGIGKVLRALRFASQAIRARLLHGADTFYYIPAPPKTAAMIRDWIVLALCRPFFRKTIFHWHAVGLGEWTSQAQKNGGLQDRLAAFLNRLLLGRHHRSIVLTEWARADVAPFSPHFVSVVGNGIADPCPDFSSALLHTRLQRAAALRRALDTGLPEPPFRICFLGHCTDEKGLFDAMEATALAAAALQQRGLSLRPVLRIAGEFPTQNDRQRFDDLRASLRRRHDLPDDWVEHAGFVGGDEKRRFLENADCLCFPTRYPAESFGLVAVEALAFGIPPITSDWRMLPELMARACLPVARAGDPASLAEALLAAIGRDDPERLRAIFLEHFTRDAHLRSLASALHP